MMLLLELILDRNAADHINNVKDFEPGKNVGM